MRSVRAVRSGGGRCDWIAMNAVRRQGLGVLYIARISLSVVPNVTTETPYSKLLLLPNLGRSTILLKDAAGGMKRGA